MLGRIAHIISNMSLNLFAIPYVNSMSTHLPHYLKRECMCETMNPGPLLIIRNTFPLHFVALLISEILKTKTLYLLHSPSKIQKYISYHYLYHYYHPCIITYHHCIFIYCFAFFIILISFSHLVLA